MGAAKPVKPNGMCAYKKGGSFIDREVDDKSMKMGGTACDDVPGINYQGRLFFITRFPQNHTQEDRENG